MKKRIFILITLLFFVTGCNCEYNLVIDGNVYKEEITLNAENSEEITTFNNNWQVPINIDEYNIDTDPSGKVSIIGDIYKHNLSGNRLIFTNDFTKNEYSKSTAVLNCYDKFTVSNFNDSIIISSSSNITCFDNYPNLNSIKINVKVDKPVTSNNADNINGNIYTWIINKGDSSKPINLVLDNSTDDAKHGSSTAGNNSTGNINSEKTNKNDYTMYIFLGVLLIIMLLAYFLYNNMKNKSDKMDD